MSNTLEYLWWDDFRVIHSAAPRRAQLATHPNAYAPLLTVKGRPGNRFTNAYDWSAANATTLLPVDGSNNTAFPDNATGCGRQFANAYLHCVKWIMGKALDGSVPFCCWPNAWGFSLADNTSAAPDSANWLAERDPWFVRLGRNDADLLPATYLGQPLDARARGASGYTTGGIAANYAWWTDFFVAAKAFIDTAVGHTDTPLEIYDAIDFPLAPDLNRLLARINSSGTTVRTFDVIRADPRWSTELINGFQTWADFYATLTNEDRAHLENPAITSLFGDAQTLVAEKLGVFRDTCTAWQVDRSLVRAARDVFGSRVRFVCEYGIVPQSPTQGTVNDRTVSFLSDRVFENRGPLTLPNGWGASPVLYQLFGLRNNATGGDLNKLALVGGYTRTGGPTPTFGADGGAAADGRLWNMFRLKENVRRTRTFGVVTVPWWNLIPAASVQTGIVPTVPMTIDDHNEVLDDWNANGVERFIIWGDPARNYTPPVGGNPPVVDYYESDFGPVVDGILPNLTKAPDPPDPPPPPIGNPNPLDLASWSPEPGIPLLRMRVFQGKRFRLPFPVLAAEPDVDLAGIVIRAQVRAAPGAALIHEFTPTQTARPGGIRFVLSADTADWPLGTVLCDVQISGPGIPATLAFRAWVRVVRRVGGV